MKIETYIDSLVSYAMNCGLAEPCDHMVLVNRLLDLLHKEDYVPSDEPQSEDLEEILAGILDYAVAKGLCDDGITARDIFDTRIMGAVTPMPREIVRTFWENMKKTRLKPPIGIINFPAIRIISAATALKKICAGNTLANTANLTLP